MSRHLPHRPWLIPTSPLLSRTCLHIDAYVYLSSDAAYLDIHATLGGTTPKARDVYDVTSFPGHMVKFDTRAFVLPSNAFKAHWTARERSVPWRAVHAHVRATWRALNPREPSEPSEPSPYAWNVASLLCHYIHAPDADPFTGKRRYARIVT